MWQWKSLGTESGWPPLTSHATEIRKRLHLFPQSAQVDVPTNSLQSLEGPRAEGALHKKPPARGFGPLKNAPPSRPAMKHPIFETWDLSNTPKWFQNRTFPGNHPPPGLWQLPWSFLPSPPSPKAPELIATASSPTKCTPTRRCRDCINCMNFIISNERWTMAKVLYLLKCQGIDISNFHLSWCSQGSPWELLSKKSASGNLDQTCLSFLYWLSTLIFKIERWDTILRGSRRSRVLGFWSPKWIVRSEFQLTMIHLIAQKTPSQTRKTILQHIFWWQVFDLTQHPDTWLADIKAKVLQVWRSNRWNAEYEGWDVPF